MTTGALLTRLQLIGITLLVFLCALLLALGTLRSEEISFVFEEGPARWITVPTPVSTNVVTIDRQDLLVTSFERRFTLAAKPAAAEIRAQAMRQVDLFVNEQRVEPDVPPGAGQHPDWKRASRFDVASLLREGDNVVRVTVTNRSGPALLRLELRAPPFVLVSDPSWSVSARGGPLAPAVRALDVRSYAEARTLSTPLRALVDHGAAVLLLFVASAGLALVAESRLPPGSVRHAPMLVALGLTLFWGGLFLTKLPLILPAVGFDGIFHMEYVRFVLERRTLPFASDGWSMYHPPLFYVLTAGLVALLEPAQGSLHERMVLRAIPLLAGLGSVWVTLAVARRFFPRDPMRAAFAVGFAGLLPMNLYMSAYVSNEALHGFWAGLALLATSTLLLQAGGSLGWAIATGLFLGLALLTKFTSVLLLPMIGFFVAAKLLVVDRAGIVRACGQVAAIVLVAAAVSGWFYVRNWLHFGDPFVWNLDLPGRFTYWQQPGFHTPAYYLRFGSALSHPWFAGFDSFWDGVYATLWSDAYIGGFSSLRNRHRAWNYEFMSAAILLAVPATLLAIAGFFRCVASSLRGDDLAARSLRAFHTTVSFGIGFSVLYMTLRVPFYGTAKAFYGLCALVPLALVTGEGFGWARDALASPGSRWPRLLFWGWVGALAGVIALSFAG